MVAEGHPHSKGILVPRREPLAARKLLSYNRIMIRIRYPDLTLKHRALGYLAGRFSFKSFATGEMLVPRSAGSAGVGGNPLSRRRTGHV